MIIPPSGRVAPKLVGRGEWFDLAHLTYADPGRLSAYEKAVARFRVASNDVGPDAYETGSKLFGDARDAEIRDQLAGEQRAAWLWYVACRQSLQQRLQDRLAGMAGGLLMAFGDPQCPGADPEWIAPRAWAYVRPDPAEDNLVRGANNAWWFVRVLDFAGFADALHQKGRVEKPPSENQHEIDEWVRRHHQDAIDAGRPPPKIEDDTEPSCRAAIGGTQRQVRIAVAKLPPELKRHRGHQREISQAQRNSDGKRIMRAD